MNDYFCVLPFFSAEYNPSSADTPCCLLPTDTNLTELRQTALSGQRHSACQKCWSLEDQGKISDRQLKNSAFDFYANRDIQIIEEDCHKSNYSTQIVKLYTSNLCNGTCIVCCNDEVSTAWATLNKRSTFKIIDERKLIDIDYANIKMLSFVGGEPLFEKKNFQILQELIKHNNTSCFISMVTNGSVTLSTQYLDILSQFKNLNFCLSIDGVGPVFEYLRYPLKWDRLLNNIEVYKKIGINLSVSYTLSNLNIFYHDQTVAWFDEMGLNYNFNLVTDPVCFSVNSLPRETKDALVTVQELFQPHTSDDDINFQSAVKELARQDQLKHISINEYLPDLAGKFQNN
jgi:hypothetical protein